MAYPELTERERRVLEAVIQSYVETAQPAGSNAIARKFGLGVSPATIRNTMSDLEEKGLLFHPHTSAGRVPTDVAYRVYVNSLLPMPARSLREHDQLSAQITSMTPHDCHKLPNIEGVVSVRAEQKLPALGAKLG